MTVSGSNRRPNQQVNAELNRIRRIIEQNPTKSDQDIIQELGIKERKYYRYKQKIIQQDTEAWIEITKQSLESAALQVKKSLDYCTKIAKDVAEHSQDQRARLEAAKKVVECQMMFYKMLQEGPTSKSISIPVIKTDSNVTDRRMESLGTNEIATK